MRRGDSIERFLSIAGAWSLFWLEQTTSRSRTRRRASCLARSQVNLSLSLLCAPEMHDIVALYVANRSGQGIRTKDEGDEYKTPLRARWCSRRDRREALASAAAAARAPYAVHSPSFHADRTIHRLLQLIYILRKANLQHLPQSIMMMLQTSLAQPARMMHRLPPSPSAP